MQIEIGSPTFHQYQEAVRSRTFTAMEKFSQDFLARNAEALREYAAKWSADPLNHWSRRWEYTYVFEQLQSHFQSGPNSAPRLLDAGSGITFFPGYLVRTLNARHVDCLDNDPTYPRVFSQLSGAGVDATAFLPGDLRAIPKPDAHYDAIYCISVLEHIPDAENTIAEFKRVLKPGGLLVITFDVALQDKNGLSETQALNLLHSLSEGMEPKAEYESLYKTVFGRKFPLTRKQIHRRGTDYGSKQEQALFFLRYAFRMFRLLDLTFFCCSFRKPSD